MSKFLILSPSEPAAGMADQRARAWCQHLVAVGHEVLVPTDYDDISTRMTTAIATHAPDAILAVSLPTAVAAARTWFAEPLWVDLPERFVDSADAIAPGVDTSAGWWLLVPLLDRADLITCAGGDDQALIVAWLGLRGRFDSNHEAGELVRVAPADPEAEGVPWRHPGLEAWWLAPRRADERFPSLSHRESYRLPPTVRWGRQLPPMPSSCSVATRSTSFKKTIGLSKQARPLWDPIHY